MRHEPIDPRFALQRLITYSALTAILAGGYLALLALVRVLASDFLGLTRPADWESLVAAAGVVVAFVPVRNVVERLAARTLFRRGYDFREVVARVTAKTHTTFDIDEMKLQFMIAIDEALRPSFIYVLTRVPDADLLATTGRQASWGDTPSPHLQVLPDDPLLTRFATDREVEYVPASGKTGMLSPLAALGPHYRVPLQVGDEVVGLVILGPKRAGGGYDGADRELLAATRLPLATALKTAAMLDDRLFKDRMEQELKRAREVQVAMLPEALPEVPGYAFAASSVPCLEASGDYYDVLDLPGDRLAITVADVAGKGIAAALATAMVKSGLYSQSQTNAEVVPMLTALNRLLHDLTRRAASKSFTTCLYAVLDVPRRVLTYSCAGHPPPIHFNARANQFSQFPLLGGFPLGVRATAAYRAQDIRLEPGDVLVFYTDGVTEAPAPADLLRGGDVEPGEPFETDRLSALVRAHHRQSALEIHGAILSELTAYTGGEPAADDVTLIVIKVLSPSTAAATGRLATEESL